MWLLIIGSAVLVCAAGVIVYCLLTAAKWTEERMEELGIDENNKED